MKKAVFSLIGVAFCIIAFGQTDTISTNIYQSNGSLGIGTTSPANKLHLVDQGTRIMMGFQPAYDGPYLNIHGSLTDSSPMLALGVANKVYYKFNDTLAMKDWGYIYGNNLNRGIAVLPDLQYASKGLYINREGNIGIGVKVPEAKLHIADGDIYISDIERGIIMKSPDGNCWRGVLDNSGQLLFSKIDCPGVEALSGPQSFQTSGDVIIYPNPSNTGVTVQHPYPQTIEYQIYNITGQIQDLGSIKSNNQIIDISCLPAGTYLLNLYDNQGNQLVSKKILKD